MNREIVQIELGGKLRTLRNDLNAMCGLDEQVDREALKVSLESGTTKLSTIRLMLWAYLITDSEDRNEQNTPKTIGAWIDPSDNLTYVLDKLMDFFKTIPKPETTESPLVETAQS